MAKRKPTAAGPSDEEIRALLGRHRCPVRFHAVRTRFLGNIASPAEFDTLDAVNELIGALVMGLWNRLTRHQDRGAPFRLTRTNIPETREGLADIALTRREEIDGFVEGLFGKEEGIELPERAHRALNALSEIRAMLERVRTLVDDPAKLNDIAATIRNVRELTKIAEHEMHQVVLSCTRARRQMLTAMPMSRPVRH